jgi:hypothetical protein
MYLAREMQQQNETQTIASLYIKREDLVALLVSHFGAGNFMIEVCIAPSTLSRYVSRVIGGV